MKLYRIGRGSMNDVRLDDGGVSRRHAELVVTRNDVFFLVDCDSTRGTFVRQGGKWTPVRQSFVNIGDTVRFGTVELTVRSLLSY